MENVRVPACAYEIHREGPEITSLKNCLGRKGPFFSNWVLSLVENWLAGEITARIFTDKWPDCTCVVVVYQLYWLSHDAVQGNTCTEVISFAGDGASFVDVLQRDGVIDLKKATKIINAVTEHVGKAISNTVQSVNKSVPVEKYTLGNLCKREDLICALPSGFFFKQLDTSHAEYIAQYWPHWETTTPSFIRTAWFQHCINTGVSVGIFTDTTPSKLVSWAVTMDVFDGMIHHLYTLKEYRGRGLACAVVKEMCSRLLDKGEVPLAYIISGNDRSATLFKNIGFTKVAENLRCFI